MFWRFGSLLDGLIVGRVDAAGLGVDQARQGVGVSRFELRRLAVIEDLPDQRMERGQLLEHVLGCRKTLCRLGFPGRRQLELAEQDLAELLGRIDVELGSAGFVDRLLEAAEVRLELGREGPEGFPVDFHSDPLHVGQDLDQRLLKAPVEGVEFFGLDPGPEEAADLERVIRVLGGVRGDFVDWGFIHRDRGLALADDLAVSDRRKMEVGHGQPV